jgi:hypothetical protein
MDVQDNSVVGQGGGGFDPNGGSGQPVNPALSSPVPGIAQNAPAAPQQPATPAAPQPQSRLASILGAVARTATTALASVPEHGRASFLNGASAGARGAQQDIANQQAIKFRDMDSQIRLANLHNQDLELQQRSQAQQDAHQKMQDQQADWNEEHGITTETHPNEGNAVMQSLQGQTAANGAASVVPGTHLSADGQQVNIPGQDADSQAGILQKYRQLAGVIPGIPNFPGQDKADHVPARNLDVMTHVLGGYNVDGSPMSHDQLKGMIGSLQAQKDQLEKNGGTPYQVQTVGNLLDIYKENEKSHQDFEDKAAAKAEKQKADTAGAVANAQLPAKQALQAQKDAAALAKQAAKPQKTDTQMYVGTDAKGNQVAGTMDDLKASNTQGITKLDTDSGKKVITARQLISPDGLFSLIRQDMDELDKKGKLGSAFQSRLNDAMLNKAGSDPDFSPLYNHTHLLGTAMMQAHVGSKGGEGFMEEFKNLANASKMSAPTLRAALGAEYKYVHEKAMLPQKASQ